MPISNNDINANQIGTYVFDRASGAIFSLSASLASPGNTTKAYATALGPLWIGEGVGGAINDINNPQYDEIAPWEFGLWAGYYKGFELTRSARNGSALDACADDTEFTFIYVTDAEYFGGTAGADVVDNLTYGYTDTTGQTVFAGNDEYYRIFEINRAYSIGNDGIFSNEFSC